MPSQMKIGESIEFSVHRSEANFDRACDEAYRLAVMMFGIDENGRSGRVDGWESSTCWIDLEFVRYIRSGGVHDYAFTARTDCEKDDLNEKDR